ncbi:MAG: twin-arginine translocation pathway signal [Pseudooceanicola sp.]|jgi:hypothetical protein|nr:twin-arginine translocation pathway signal [Pseudooceanicola sp.]
MATRRAFLATLLAAGAAPRLGWADVGQPTYLAAAREPDGGFAMFGLDEAGADMFRVPLPARGHAGAAHPTRAEAVAFARRPGRFALVIDCASGTVRHNLTPPEGMNFNGHGAFSPDGAMLFTSEQMADTSAGRIGMWDVRGGYRRIGAVDSGGIGPHDLRLMPDGLKLVVANGGIATDPATRDKLNLATMRPNLTYLTLEGALAEQVDPLAGLHQNSIRHLALGADGTVGVAMQWQGEDGAAPPLIALHRPGRAALEPAEAPLADELTMKGYAGSIAISGAGTEVAITSPKGGRIHRFAVEDGAFLGHVARADVCGLAPARTGLVASDGHGGLIALEGDRTRPLARQDRNWDNHLVALRG